MYELRTDSRQTLTAIVILAIAACILAGFIGTSRARHNTRVVLATTVVPVTIVSDSENAVQWKTVQMRVTAYCPCSKCCGSYSDGITASGHKISQGDRFVAADKTYPFGTEMLIPGYNTGDGYKNSKKCDNSNEHKNSKECESSKNNGAVEVLDRGGAIRGKRLDVFFNTHQEALEWGVRHLDVKIREQ